MDEKKLDNKIWDYTSISTFVQCRKKYYYRMVKHLAPIRVSAPLTFGKVMHDALATYYTDGLEKAIALFRETYVNPEGEELRTVETGIRCLETYAEVYKKEPFVLASTPEVGFVIPMGDVLWGGRLDLPVIWDGDLYVFEHKTTTQLNTNYIKQFDLDGQITGYAVGAEEFFGKKCLGCIVNVIELWKPLIRPRATSKKPDEHFLRAPIARSQFMKDTFKRNVNLVVKEIKKCHETNEWCGAYSRDVCRSYNSDCPYKALCQFGEDERIIKREFIVDEWAPYDQKEESNVAQ